MILERIENPVQFSGTDLTIVAYLEQHLHDLDSITIRSLAEATYTSPATVNRFCNKICGSGFKDFKIRLIREVDESHEHPHAVDYNVPFSFRDSIKTIGENLGALQTRTITDAANSLNYDNIQRLINMIFKCERLFLFGKGESALCAAVFQQELLKINKYCVMAEENSNTAYSIQNIRPSDLAFFVTYSGNHKSYNNYIPMLNRRHIPTAILTSNGTTQLCRNCDCQIVITHNESNDEKIANFSSTPSMIFVLDIIYAGLFKYNYTNNINDRIQKEKFVTDVMLDDKSY